MTNIPTSTDIAAAKAFLASTKFKAFVLAVASFLVGGTVGFLVNPGPGTPVPVPSPSVSAPSPSNTQNPASFPNSGNTGVPAGTALVNSGSVTVSTPGAVVSGLNISGSVVVAANNVTIKNCKIAGGAYSEVWVNSGVSGTVIENNEINGLGATGNNNAVDSTADNGTISIDRNNIYGFENGLVPGSNASIVANYIHGLLAPSGAHYDGIQMDGGLSNISITDNTVINQYGQTSAVMIDNYYGPVNGITVDGNYLSGGGYTVYADAHFNTQPLNNVRYTNNSLGKGFYGYSDINGANVVWSGNTDHVTGATV